MKAVRNISRIFSKNRKSATDIPPNVDLARNFLFVHIPKTAGTTLYKALGLGRSHHYFLSEYRDFVDGSTFDGLFKFAFVRNPVDRFVSLYNYARMEVSHFHNNISPEKAEFGVHEDYELLKDASLYQCAQYLLDDSLTHNHPRSLWLPQTLWLEEAGRLADIDFLGRVEESPTCFERLFSELGVDASVSYQNLSAKAVTSVDVDSKTRNILQQYYGDDFENFSYEI